MKRITLIAVLILGLASCKDKTIEEVVETAPVFQFKGEINGEPLQLAAGVNDYALTFATEQDFFGIYNYNCSIDAADCPTCGPSIHVKIYGLEEKGPNDNPNYANDLAIGEKEFLTDFTAANNLSFHFFANENNNDLNHYWAFGDGVVSTQTNPEHTYSTPGSYTVTHILENEQNISTSTTFTIEAGTPNAFCSLPFRANEEEPNEIHFHHPYNLPDFLQCQTWTIYNQAGEIIYTTNQNNFDYNLAPNQTYSVCLSFNNTITNCEASYCLSIDNTQPGPFNDPGFQIAPETLEPIIGKVIVEYRDDNGQLYHSAFEANDENQFEITESEFYTPANSQAPITRKLKMLMNCVLINANNPNEQIQLENAEAIFAFEIE